LGLRTFALIVGLALLGVAALWWLGGEHRGARSSTALEESASSQSAVELAASDVPFEPATASTAKREATPASEAPAERPSSAAASAASDDVLVLEVIDGTSNTPVADALVRYSTSEHLAEWS